MSPKREIYLLDPKLFSPEVIAVAFAKTSRDPNSFRQNAAELDENKSAKFHEKWVVGYGHGSVAEHAVMHIAFENVSRLAADAIEANRLASYTEKSTRFQIMDSNHVYTPDTVARSKRAKDYAEVMSGLFRVYGMALQRVGDLIRARNPGLSDARIRTKYVDLSRSALPTATLSNVGMTVNGRSIEYALTKLQSHRLAEVRTIGTEAKAVTLTELPTLVKYADPSSHILAARNRMEATYTDFPAEDSLHEQRYPSVDLVDFDKDGETKVMASLLYRYNGKSMEQCLYAVRRLMTDEQKLALLESAYGSFGKYDKPGREMELPVMTWDITLDWASYRDFWRHRMETPIAQEMDGYLGFALPKVLEEVGVDDDTKEAIRRAADLAVLFRSEFEEGEDNYLYTNATLRRLLMHMNLREAVEFWRLRSAPDTNPGYRILALQVGEILEKTYPVIWQFMKGRAKDETPTSQQIFEEFYGRG